MTAYELAKLLLEGPDLPVVVYDRDRYVPAAGAEYLKVDVCAAKWEELECVEIV